MPRNSDKQKIIRAIDANLNRSREGLRVCEDIIRFLLDDAKLARRLKRIRHNIFLALKASGISYIQLLGNRDSVNDVGRITTAQESTRQNWQAVFSANIERVKESVRALEELSKIINKNVAERFKKIRFSIYDIEKEIIIKYKVLSDSGYSRPKAAGCNLSAFAKGVKGRR